MSVTEATTVSLVRTLCATGEARKTREAAHLSLAEAGNAIGVAPAVLARWETGQAKPRKAAALRYAALLGELEAIAQDDDRDRRSKR
jgi:transcriptional regulator with XRE-family HTH domain